MVTFTLSKRSGMEFRSGSSRPSSGSTKAVSTGSPSTCSSIQGASLAWPTPEGTLTTVTSGRPVPPSTGNACGKSTIFCRMKKDDLLALS